jgi:hypothetical protein
MATQEFEGSHEDLVRRLSEAQRGGGFALRKQQQDTQSTAWRATVVKHVPEPWPAARLALQARIAALEAASRGQALRPASSQ